MESAEKRCRAAYAITSLLLPLYLVENAASVL